MTGIYKITNTINNKIYIGQSKDIQARWEEHKYYSKDKTILQYAFKKYGISNFLFEIIEECPIDELDNREKYWIQFYDSYENGYNMTLGGRDNVKNPIDSELILKTYELTKSIHKTAEQLNYSRTSIRKVLDLYLIEYNKNISNTIPIKALDPYTLKEIKSFPSIQDGASWAHISDSAIRKSLKLSPQQPYAGGYYWEKSNENLPLIPLSNKPQNTKSKQIICYDRDGNQIAEYPSLSKANLAMKVSRSNQKIKKVCENELESAYGFLWRYK